MLQYNNIDLAQLDLSLEMKVTFGDNGSVYVNRKGNTYIGTAGNEFRKSLYKFIPSTDSKELAYGKTLILLDIFIESAKKGGIGVTKVYIGTQTVC